MNNTIIPNKDGSDFTVLPEPPTEIYVAMRTPPQPGALEQLYVCTDRAPMDREIQRANEDDDRLRQRFGDIGCAPLRLVRYVRSA